MSIIEGYCSPISVAGGQNISFHISSQLNFRLEFVCLSEAETEKMIIVGGIQNIFPAGVYPTPLRANETGCNWPSLLLITIPTFWNSGTSMELQWGHPNSTWKHQLGLIGSLMLEYHPAGSCQFAGDCPDGNDAICFGFLALIKPLS